MEMKELIGRKVNLLIKITNSKKEIKDLFYTGTILSCEGKHFTFSDRDQNIYMFRKEAVVEINDRILEE